MEWPSLSDNPVYRRPRVGSHDPGRGARGSRRYVSKGGDQRQRALQARSHRHLGSRGQQDKGLELPGGAEALRSQLDRLDLRRLPSEGRVCGGLVSDDQRVLLRIHPPQFHLSFFTVR